MKKGLLLVNLGSPNSPSIPDVRRYLGEFLMDKDVIDIPAPMRWLLVNAMILPFRAKNTSQAYAKIWTKDGSPLIQNTFAFSEKLSKLLEGEFEIEVAMRYGSPSINSALQKLQKKDITELIVFPLYPQWAASSTGTALSKVNQEIDVLWEKDTPTLRVIPAFYEHVPYLKAASLQIQSYLKKNEWDHIIFSYHGLPQRHIRKSESEENYCLKKNYSCCDTIDHRNHNCYRAQCVYMTNKIVKALKIPLNQYTLCFQSRLGKDPWILPNTTDVISDLAQKGVKKIISVSPSFVADCLETLEEMKLRNSESFIKMGGETFVQIPSLNDDDAWVEAAKDLVMKGGKLSRLP